MIVDRALSADEMARAGGRRAAVPLPTPSPAVAATAPPLPAEAAPLPREGVLEGFDVSGSVQVDERPGFTVYRFSDTLGRAQPLDVELGLSSVWVGTSLGLLRHDLRSGAWKLWDERSTLPGPRIDEIAVFGRKVVADTSKPTGPGSVIGTGVFAFDTVSSTWTPFQVTASVWDLRGDGAGLWIGLNTGAEWRDGETGAARRFDARSRQLAHDTVHAVRRHGDTVGFASLGRYVEATKDFDGGGVALWDRRSDRYQLFGVRDGLARGYSCDLHLDDEEVWVAHWDAARGLSRLDRRSGRWEAVRRSANGVEIGGVVLAGEPATLWIGQQGALVKLDRRTRNATVFREQDGLPGHIVSGIAIGDDAVWASVYSYGQGGVRVAGLVRFPRGAR